jgi:hypothetical protein
VEDVPLGSDVLAQVCCSAGVSVSVCQIRGQPVSSQQSDGPPRRRRARDTQRRAKRCTVCGEAEGCRKLRCCLRASASPQRQKASGSGTEPARSGASGTPESSSRRALFSALRQAEEKKLFSIDWYCFPCGGLAGAAPRGKRGAAAAAGRSLCARPSPAQSRQPLLTARDKHGAGRGRKGETQHGHARNGARRWASVPLARRSVVHWLCALLGAAAGVCLYSVRGCWASCAKSRTRSGTMPASTCMLVPRWQTYARRSARAGLLCQLAC